MCYTIAYGALLTIALPLAWRSHVVVYQQLGFLMFLSWAIYNLVVRVFGFPHGLLIDAMADALIATAAGTVGLRHRSATAFVVIMLFVAEECWHLTASVTGQEGSLYYHSALNAIFALQVLIIGGGAGVSLARSRTASAPRRASPYRLVG